MRHVHFIAAGLVLLCASSSMANDPTLTTRLPEGTRIWARGDTLQQLVQRAHADLTFTEASGQQFLLWSCHTYSGKPFFRLASAIHYQPKSGKHEWLVSDSRDGLWNYDTIIPRHAITSRGKSFRFGPGVDRWWQIVSANPTYGTVYEVEYYHQVTGEAAMGTRLVVPKKPDAHWQFVAAVPGDYWDDTSWQTQTKIHVLWTGDPEIPLTLTAKSHGEIYDKNIGIGITPHYITEMQYTGKLPALRRTSVRYLLKVRKGETFNQLLKLMIDDDMIGEPETVKKKVIQALRARILALNPGLDVEYLAVGQEIVVPSGSDQNALIKAATNAVASTPSSRND